MTILQINSLDLKLILFKQQKPIDIYDINAIDDYEYEEIKIEEKEKEKEQLPIIPNNQHEKTQISSTNLIKQALKSNPIYYLSSEATSIFSFYDGNTIAYIQSKVLYFVETFPDTLKPINSFPLSEYNINYESITSYSINNLNYVVIIDRDQKSLIFINSLKRQRNKTINLQLEDVDTNDIKYEIFTLPNYSNNEFIIVFTKNEKLKRNIFHLVSFESSEVVKTALFKGNIINLCDVCYYEKKNEILVALTFKNAKYKLFIGLLDFQTNSVNIAKDFKNIIDNIKFSNSQEIIVSFERNQEHHLVVSLSSKNLNQIKSLSKQYNLDFLILKSLKYANFLFIIDDKNLMHVIGAQNFLTLKNIQLGDGVIKKLSVKELCLNDNINNSENEIIVLSDEDNEVKEDVLIEIYILMDVISNFKKQSLIKCFNLKYKK